MFGLFKKKKPEPVEVTPDHATLYIADPSLLGSKVLDTVTGILSYEGTSNETGNATGLRLRLIGLVMRMLKIVLVLRPRSRSRNVEIEDEDENENDDD